MTQDLARCWSQPIVNALAAERRQFATVEITKDVKLNAGMNCRDFGACSRNMQIWLIRKLYQKAVIPLKEAEPIKAIGELLLIGLGIPLLLLGVGFVLAWALRGFSTAH
jgi:hypothetical protein